MTEKEKVQGFCLKDKSACVIGCGGLGCNIAVHLAGAGIGKLYLCDFDSVSESNLNRQFLYTKNDIGENKCQKAADRLRLYSNDTEFISINRKITAPKDMDFAEKCDIILLAVDNAQARRSVTESAVKQGIPLVCGGIDGFYGVAYLYIPEFSPCPDCAGLNSESTAEYNISVTAGIIGSTQAALAVKYLLTADKQLSGKMLIYDGDRFDTLQIKPSKSCFICNKLKI